MATHKRPKPNRGMSSPPELSGSLDGNQGSTFTTWRCSDLHRAQSTSRRNLINCKDGIASYFQWVSHHPEHLFGGHYGRQRADFDRPATRSTQYQHHSYSGDRWSAAGQLWSSRGSNGACPGGLLAVAAIFTLRPERSALAKPRPLRTFCWTRVH